MGIYIHIPFCKQACHYCNFYFTTTTKYQDQMVAAILAELSLQRDYLGQMSIQSIYFGGGTPSILSEKYLAQILDRIHQLFVVEKNAEITLEANPDDLSRAKLKALQSIGVNRLSIGIQSFRGADLSLMNRAHTPVQALEALEQTFDVGFVDVNVDLIYGLPTSTNDDWLANIEKAFSFPINHLSAYALTVEPKTALDHFIRKGTYPPIIEEQANQQFEMLMNFVKEKGWIHYEISNFSRLGKEARHNTSYWQGKPYLGVGPSAHSFDGVSRQWNIANNQTYMKSIASQKIPAEVEYLDVVTRYNEYVMTGLRTTWGCSLAHIASYGADFVPFFRKEAQSKIEEGLLIEDGEQYKLTHKGLFFADLIASDLMWA